MKKFDDVHIKSKNLTGMIYAIRGNTLVVKTVKGLVKTTKDDVELIATESIMNKSELRKIIREEILREGFENKLSHIMKRAGFELSDASNLYSDRHWDLDHNHPSKRTVATFKNSSARDKALKVIERSNEFNPVKYKDNMITFKHMGESKQHGLKEGFTGWEHWLESDTSSDLMYSFSKLLGRKDSPASLKDADFNRDIAKKNEGKIKQLLDKAMKDPGNEYNISGVGAIVMIAVDPLWREAERELPILKVYRKKAVGIGRDKFPAEGIRILKRAAY